MHGDSDRFDVIKEGVKSKLQEALPPEEMGDHDRQGRSHARDLR